MRNSGRSDAGRVRWPLTTEFAGRWVAGMVNAHPLAIGGREDFPRRPEAGDQHCGDIHVTWRPTDDGHVFAGIVNVGDVPPLAGFDAPPHNTIPNLCDALAARVHGSVRIGF